MRFESPWWLLAIVIPIVLAVVYVAVQSRRGAYALRFTDLDLLDVVAPERPDGKRHVPAIALLVGLTALVVAMARPVRVSDEVVQRATVILALDVSLSMEADDVEPSRLQAMQEAVKAFAADAPDSVEIGLITFAGTAQLRVPPTTDRDQLTEAVDRIRLAERTAIGEAVFAGIDALQATAELGDIGADESGVPTGSQRLVVMSDGETTTGRTNDEAAAAAKEAGIPVFTIAYGTAQGTIVYDGQVEPVPVNGPELERIAVATGGQFFEAASEDQLTAVLDELGSRGETEERTSDLFPWFVGFGLVALVAASAMSLAWFQRLP